MVEKVYVTYNDVSALSSLPRILPHSEVVHKLCQEAAVQILKDFQPNLMIAIGGGGYVPARILRSFLKQPGSPNIPIQAIGLSLYEQLPETHPASGTTTPGAVEQIGHKVTRTQWLDLTSLGGMENLVGKRILIVDEVDDTRTTLEYAVKELEKDVEQVRQRLGLNEETQFGIFVLHNKDKPKKGTLPAHITTKERYVAARTVGDIWICYPGRPQTSKSTTKPLDNSRTSQVTLKAK
ncbi:phosphoribosyl transferase [Apiospora phragmitis]|uniref:Phosphoribosyl transferase n=1 Tax=Apiospora phragmitis TaxID=2905665 RepID=A0ABR1VF51_9PEZI